MSIPNAPFGLLGNAPMQTQLVDGQRSVTPPWGGWLNWLRQWLFLNIPTVFTPSTGASASADPIANGAVGNGVADDTAIVQQTINNSGGILYLRPNKNFLLSSTITAPTPSDVVHIYGGGRLTSSANPILSIPHGNWVVEEIIFIATANSTLLSIVSNGSQQAGIRKCFFANGSGIGIALNGSGIGATISDCSFSGLGTGIALTSQTDVQIVNCELTGATTPVSTSGTCTYNLRGCSGTFDTYPSSATSATASAGGGAAVPATVKTFIEVQVVLAGVLTTVKIPAFSV